MYHTPPTRMAWRSLVAGVVSVLLAPPGTAPAAPAVSSRAAPDPSLTDFFASLTPSGWAGADGISSIRLPDGRTVWLFQDTVLKGWLWAHNSMVITGGRATQVTANLLPTLADGSFFWPGASVVRGNELWILAQHVVHWGPGLWDFGSTGTWLSRVDLRTWRVNSEQQIADMTHRTAWSSALLNSGVYTYIYGVESAGLGTWLHVARVPRGQLDLPWQFFTGTDWTSDPGRSARLVSGVSSNVSLLDLGRRGLRLVSQQPLFGRRVYSWRATSPVGPFTARRTIYDTGTLGADLYTYGAIAHPALATRTTMLFSFNGNSCELVNHDTLKFYRPHFFRVPLARL